MIVYRRVKIGSKEAQALRAQGAQCIMMDNLAGVVGYLVEEKTK